MKFGVNVFITDNGIDPGTAARAAEEAGLDSIFVGDHTHMPAAPNLDSLVRDCYAHFIDMFMALTAMSVVTTTLRLGTGVCIVPQHEPLGLAKQVATLDRLSNGRVVFGVGAGWNALETRNHGIDPDRRFAVMREYIQAMQRLWTDEVAEVHGEYVDFSPSWSWPKPAQRPHQPIIVGGRGPRVLDRVFEYGDGWGPEVVGGLAPILAIAPQMALFQRRRGATERPITATAMGVELNANCVEAVVELGFDHCLFSIPAVTAQAILDGIAVAGNIARRYSR